MEVNQGPLWAMLVVACVVGVVLTFRSAARAGHPWRERWYTDRRGFVGGSIDALITGIGLGMVAVLIVLLVAAVLVRLGL